jgi:transcriptional repressor NrdR
MTSRDIGEIVMKHLKKFDKIAFIRFASIYEAFEDVDTFEEVISKLGKRKKR